MYTPSFMQIRLADTELSGKYKTQTFGEIPFVFHSCLSRAALV